MWVRPEAPADGPRLGLEGGKNGIPRVPPEPPRQSDPDQLLAEAPAVGQADLGQEAAVPIPARRFDDDHLSERECRGELSGALAVSLAALRSVDTEEPDDLRSVDPEDRERVAVGDVDDPAGEPLGRRRAGQQEQSDGDAKGSQAAWQGVQDSRDAPTCPAPSADRCSSGTAAAGPRCPRCRGSRGPGSRAPGHRRARAPP